MSKTLEGFTDGDDYFADDDLRLAELSKSIDEDGLHCPKCGEEWVWDGDSERSRFCPSCH